jgi:hypothetical protein
VGAREVMLDTSAPEWDDWRPVEDSGRGGLVDVSLQRR